MRRLITLILIAGFVAFGLMFGTLNESRVKVDYFFLSTEWPLALSLMCFFAAGVAVGGLFVYSSMWLGLRQRVREIKRQQQAGESELPSQPLAPIKTDE